MWSDNETSIDLLQFKYLAAAVTRLVRTPHLLPTTIGVFGDWGSGKSSLLKMVDAELAADPTITRLNFNGWLFEGYDDAKTALMGTILDAIQERNEKDQTLLEKTRERLNALRKRVNLLQLASLAGRIGLPAALGHPHLSVAGAGAAAAHSIYKAMSDPDKNKRMTVEDIEKLLPGAQDAPDDMRRSVRDFRKEFALLLQESKIETLVVFIDDLDRCLPDTIIATLEAIRLFLFVPGTVFILGADERLVEYAVRQRFPELPGTRAEVGRDYLEKLIQVPVRIPPLSGAEVHSYMNLLFAQLRMHFEDYPKVCDRVAQFRHTNINDLSFDIGVARDLAVHIDPLAELGNDLDFVAQIADILIPGMQGNPRRTKRFLNMLLLRLSLGEARGLSLQRQVLAKLMLLEYIKPEFFKQLAGLQAVQEGRPEELLKVEQSLRPHMGTSSGSAQDAHPTQSDKQKPTAGTRAADSVSESSKPSLTATGTSKEELPGEVQPWLADEWMRTWLASTPALSDVDLRPYFYVAHDKVGVLDIGQARLSPAAGEVLNRLLDSQQITRRLGVKQAANLNAADATAVFQALAQRIRQAASLEGNASQAIMFELMETCPSLIPQLITLYGSLSDAKITLAVPAKLYQIVDGTPGAQAARALFERWAASTNTLLAGVAKQALTRPWKPV